MPGAARRIKRRRNGRFAICHARFFVVFPRGWEMRVTAFVWRWMHTPMRKKRYCQKSLTESARLANPQSAPKQMFGKKDNCALYSGNKNGATTANAANAKSSPRSRLTDITTSIIPPRQNNPRTSHDGFPLCAGMTRGVISAKIPVCASRTENPLPFLLLRRALPAKQKAAAAS